MKYTVKCEIPSDVTIKRKKNEATVYKAAWETNYINKRRPPEGIRCTRNTDESSLTVPIFLLNPPRSQLKSQDKR